MNEIGFSINIFYPVGDKNCCIIKRDDYHGVTCYSSSRDDMIALSFGRDQVFNAPAVYFLLQGNRIYIGEADPFSSRIRDHYSSKPWFDQIILFTGDHFNKAKIQYLEASLILKAWKNKSLIIENKKRQNLPTLSENDKSDAERILHYILDTLLKLNLNYFVETPEVPETVELDEETIKQLNDAKLFFCSGKGVRASAIQHENGLIIKAGSYMVKEETLSISSNCKSIRHGLKSSGILIDLQDKLKLTKDHFFNSPSAASGCVLGKSSNGQIDWVDENKKPFKDFNTKTT